MDALTLRPSAKVNLALEVLGTRPDGYHDVATVLHTIGMHDRLTLVPSKEVSLECDAPGLGGPDNLALRAALLLRDWSGVRQGVTVRLEKGIPLGSGLGGGSSDAAATLRGLNTLWGLGLALGEMAELAAQLGSDVPFFVYGGAALARGRGERVTPLPPAKERWLVVVAPDLRLPNKTATLYGRLTPSQFTSGAAADSVAAAMRDGLPWPEERMVNAFEGVADSVFPALDRYKREMAEAGARRVHLAGSGPALFAMVESAAQGEGMARALAGRGIAAHATRTVAPGEEA